MFTSRLNTNVNASNCSKLYTSEDQNLKLSESEWRTIRQNAPIKDLDGYDTQDTALFQTAQYYRQYCQKMMDVVQTTDLKKYQQQLFMARNDKLDMQKYVEDLKKTYNNDYHEFKQQQQGLIQKIENLTQENQDLVIQVEQLKKQMQDEKLHNDKEYELKQKELLKEKSLAAQHHAQELSKLVTQIEQQRNQLLEQTNQCDSVRQKLQITETTYEQLLQTMGQLKYNYTEKIQELSLQCTKEPKIKVQAITNAFTTDVKTNNKQQTLELQQQKEITVNLEMELIKIKKQLVDKQTEIDVFRSRRQQQEVKYQKLEQAHNLLKSEISLCKSQEKQQDILELRKIVENYKQELSFYKQKSRPNTSQTNRTQVVDTQLNNDSILVEKTRSSSPTRGLNYEQSYQMEYVKVIEAERQKLSYANNKILQLQKQNDSLKMQLVQMEFQNGGKLDIRRMVSK
ncbi:Hypothetical_protein [Hexamita inflata]|uniref:Hypothetical_protein n=1 Tax=Hexamita inflata TaxID=28002 RepID=A0ABP1GJN5_9EUKA